MTEFNSVGKSHSQTAMPKDIVERSHFENTDVIQYSLMPGIKDTGTRLQSWGESRTATLGGRKVDLRMGGGRRDKATGTLTKTAILARGHSFQSPRNPVCQIHPTKVRNT